MEVTMPYFPNSEMSLRNYAGELVNSGTRVFQYGKETFWVGYELGALMRIPSFYVGPPASGEVRQILRGAWLAVATYLLNPDELHPGNCWLYVCTDSSYGLEKLPSTMRRNVRRGLRELQIQPITIDELLSHGAEAFCDTRKRVGLSDGTLSQFHQRFKRRGVNPAHVFWGAWKDEKLAAFLSVTEVEQWAEIEGCFSANSMLSFRPNDTLFYCALSHYLTQKKYQTVSYGLSSIQEASNAETLHTFKVKVGFEARLVHRAFDLHPYLRPMQNMTTLALGRILLKLVPGNRLLKKGVGMLASVLNEE